MGKWIFGALIAAMVLGIAVGAAIHGQMPPDAAKEIAGYINLVSVVFLRLIKMVVGLLVLTTLTAGIANLGSGGEVGRIGFRTMAWFIAASLVSLGLGLLMVNWLQPGVNFPVAPDTSLTPPDASKFSVPQFITNVFPNSMFEPFVKTEVLQIVVISLFVGIALQSLGEKTRALRSLIEEGAEVMLKITNYIMLLAPFAVFAALANTVAINGLGVLVSYGKLVGAFFLALLMLWCLLIAAGLVVLGPRVFRLLWDVRSPLLLAFSTASSEAAYPRLLEELQRHGASNRVVSFVLPLGYSFNLDGSMMYCAFASLFIAQALGMDIPMAQQIGLLLLLMITSKGIAGVPRASLVVIMAALPFIGVNPNMIVLVLAVDAFMDMGRTATNVIGNSIATAVIAKWEGALGPVGSGLQPAPAAA
jgi:Na+/H+-dicarboxylate symporter